MGIRALLFVRRKQTKCRIPRKSENTITFAYNLLQVSEMMSFCSKIQYNNTADFTKVDVGLSKQRKSFIKRLYFYFKLLPFVSKYIIIEKYKAPR